MTDPIVAQLTAPGAPFEMAEAVIDGRPAKVWKHTPATLPDLYDRARQFADRTLAVFENRRVSYVEALAEGAGLAHGLVERFGIAGSARVAIIMRNRPEWMTAFMGITAAGGSAVLVSPRGTAGELQAALDQTDCVLVIADVARAKLLAEAGDTRPRIVVEDEPGAERFGTPFRSVAGDGAAAFPSVAMQPDDETVVMFTSGTTSRPKGAMLTHRAMLTGFMNIQFAMANVFARVAQHYGPEAAAEMAKRQPSSLVAYPMVHVSGCTASFLSNLGRGGKIVLVPKWNPQTAIDLIEQEKVAQFSGAPTMIWDVLRTDRTGRDLSSLVSVGIGGQATPLNLLAEMRAAFPNAVPGGGFGMTETCGGGSTISGPDLVQRPTSSGRPAPTVEMSVQDESGRILPDGEVGEVCIRGAMVMKGYCGDPAATAAAIRDGWMHTGDLGYFDADGFIHIVDRLKNIVISGGENISCAEVERVAMTHPDVEEAAGFGVVDDRLGEKMVLAVVPRPGKGVDEEALKAHIGSQLAIFKVPRHVIQVDRLPRNHMEKIDRNALRRQFQS